MFIAIMMGLLCGLCHVITSYEFSTMSTAEGLLGI